MGLDVIVQCEARFLASQPGALCVAISSLELLTKRALQSSDGVKIDLKIRPVAPVQDLSLFAELRCRLHLMGEISGSHFVT